MKLSLIINLIFVGILLLILLHPFDAYAEEVSCGRVNVYVINLYTGENVPNARAGIRCSGPDDPNAIPPLICSGTDFQHNGGACWENSGYLSVAAPP